MILSFQADLIPSLFLELMLHGTRHVARHRSGQYVLAFDGEARKHGDYTVTPMALCARNSVHQLYRQVAIVDAVSLPEGHLLRILTEDHNKIQYAIVP